MSTKVNDQTLQKCADHEPIFVLRAQDKSAVNTIKFWIHLQECQYLPPKGKIKAANALIKEMEEWQRNHKVKSAD